MPAILAKKLGMTQRFLGDGKVERVTVLEAGPCPVTAIRTHDADGYEAVQLGFGAVREKALNKPLLGHLLNTAADLARAQKLLKGYRVVINTGDDGGQTVHHLHLHLLGGRHMTWPPG